MQVLIAVASRFVQQVLKRHLSFLTQPATYCSSIAEARDLFGKSGFDLICIEGILADGKGIEFARALRLGGNGEKVPILLLSGNDDTQTTNEALAAGITEVFAKSDVEALADFIGRQEASEMITARLKGHALVVEDSRSVANIFEKMLDRLGMTAQIFARAEDALAGIGKRKTDLVVTDVQLEGNMTGLGLVRGIRQMEGRAARIPILAVSGLNDSARKIELLRLGANDFISKPVQEDEFAARVRNMVHLAQLLDESEAQREHLRRLAMTDQLTGLFNRHYMADIAAKRVPEALRHAIPVSLLVLDLDHFKHINDAHGHDVGDVVLAETGALIRKLCNSGEIAARSGGEEFVVVLINRDSRKAQSFAETLRCELEALRPAGLTVTASIGVGAVARGEQTDFQTLFKAADEAAYAAKKNGRNCVMVKEISRG
ncbi:MAG: diguanylate cyclase [Rhodocyclaceae bacterium]|nr:diguanylate cyclase [Rhodocyclaceae bacterium]